MQKLLREYMDELNRRRKKNRRTGIAVLVLVVIVFGSVMGVLTQYGVAMTGKPQCGLEEHTHTDECYEKTLVCGLEESEGHTHTDDCLYPAELTCGLEESESHTHTDECYTVPEGYACGLEESESHTHTDECYEETLVCGKEEHIHTDACYIDAESDEAAVNAEEAVAGADVEDAAAWDSQYTEVEWKGAWGEDLVTAAQIQIGYQESADNYTAAADGSQKGYTRFGHFAGDMYADWDAAFVNFCLHYAGIKESGYFPEETDTAKWREAFEQIREENAEYLTTPENYIPTAGDIVFFQKENEETDMQMGIVSAVNEHNRTIAVIEGNNGNEVKETEYSLDDAHIVNYLMLSSAENAYKNAGDAGEATAETEENWAYEESFETENVVIHVKAKEGVVPEGAVLSVTPIEKTEITEDMPEEEAAKAEEINEQYELTNQKLLEESEKKEEVLQGFLAYDICFMVDGQETEPNGEVNVTMDFKEAIIPEGVSEDAAVTVTHLKEDESAEDGIVVEDLTEKEAATVTTAEENASVEKVELVAESFSIFTIAWQIWSEQFSGWMSKWNIPIIHRTENGIDLGDRAKSEYSNIELNIKYALEDQLELKEITKDGKSYLPSQIKLVNSRTGEEHVVEKIMAGQDDKLHFYSSADQEVVYCTPNSDNWEDSHMAGNWELHVIYQFSDAKIISKITEEGNLTVELGSELSARFEEAENKEYVWYKSVNSGEFVRVDLENYGNGRSNISGENNSILNVALDNGAKNEAQLSVEYKVAVSIDGEEITTSAPFSVPYYSEIQNGSFEDTELAEGAMYQKQITADRMGGWKTTASDGYMEVARVENGKIASEYNYKGTFEAAHGSKFAELNANQEASLYQDVLTIRGTQLDYSFAHRARPSSSGADRQNTMYLVIIPTFVAERGVGQYSGDSNHIGAIDTQSEVNYLIEHRNDKDGDNLRYPGVYVQKYTAYTGQWVEHSGIYVPEYDLNRFFFVSAEQNPHEGNFIDNVWFSQKLPKPEENTFNFRIVKTISGVECTSLEVLKDKIKDLEFVIEVKEKNMTDSTELEGIPNKLMALEMEWTNNGDGTYTGVRNYYNTSIAKGKEYVITVTEENEKIDDYNTVDSSVTRVSSGETRPTEKGKTGTVEVGTGAQERLVFNNAYSNTVPVPVASWKMIKCSSTKDSAGKRLNTPPGAEFEVTDKHGNVVATGESGKDGVIIWTTIKSDQQGEQQSTEWKPSEGEFSITETKAPTGYSIGGPWTVTFTNGVPKINDITSEESVNGDIVIYLENTPVYSLPSTGGSGIFWYMFSGVLLMAGATLFLYKNKVQGGAGKLG